MKMDVEESDHKSSNFKHYNQLSFYGQFQSHESEFDYLKSLEIDEKINRLCWMPRTNNTMSILTTNDKTIKLWKVFEKPILKPSLRNNPEQVHNCPEMVKVQVLTAAVPRRLYANGHKFHINSLDLNSDCETFLSGDDLRVNIWNIERQDNSWTVVDLKPEKLEQLDECITHCKFHPAQCNLLGYTTGKGLCYLADLRTNAKVEKAAKIFGQTQNDEWLTECKGGYFSDILRQFSYLEFSLARPNIVVTRDFGQVHIWDQRYEQKPITEINTDPTNQLSQVVKWYENDSIFHIFKMAANPFGPEILTGSVNGNFMVANWETGKVDWLRSDLLSERLGRSASEPMDIDSQGECRNMCVAWHNKQDTIGVSNGHVLSVHTKLHNQDSAGDFGDACSDPLPEEDFLL